MSSEIYSWLAVVFRFVHVLAAIMWIGESIYFMWLDHSLKLSETDDKSKSQGKLWMIHGGGIFHVNKRILKPAEFPKVLHWFKWEAYTTWLTGFALILLTVYINGGKQLLSEEYSGMSSVVAVHLGLAFILLSWVVYDIIWRSPLKNNELVASLISFLLLFGSVYFLCKIFNGRQAYLHIGAMLGTLMAGNVAMHIMPNQRRMVKALKEGKEHDLKYSNNAKQRSRHNNYMTFPVLFMMLGMHFPQAHGSKWNWIILIIFILGLATIKHFMNIKTKFSHWLYACIATFIVCAILLWYVTDPASNINASKIAQGSSASAVDIAKGKELYAKNICGTCHDRGGTELGPDLNNIYNKPVLFTDGTWQIIDDQYIKDSIMNPNNKIVRGYQTGMTPYKEILSETDLNYLVAYIRSLTKPKDVGKKENH